MPEGLVLWGVKNIYYVYDQTSSKEYKCIIKGKVLDTDFNIKGRKETNPIVVGDIVTFKVIDSNQGVILERKKRTNEFKRLKKDGRVVQTLFANIDYMLIVDSVLHPPLRPYFIDRCLFSCEYFNIEPIIIFNKIDLLNENKNDLFEKSKKIYKELGYKIFETSVLEKKGIKDLYDFINGKICSLNGRSGVGKSSLIKAIAPSIDLKIGDINEKYDRGTHTTTFAKIYRIDNKTMIIDTPGIRELSIFIDRKDYVEKYIKDFNYFRDKCKFQNCQHINEKDCAVLKAISENKIDESRYESYLRIRESVVMLDDSKIT